MDTHIPATPAAFRQLHVKLPTEDPTVWLGPPIPGARNKNNRSIFSESQRWLADHPSGFLMMRNMQPEVPLGFGMLLESLDTGKIIFHKRIRRRTPLFKPPYPSIPEPFTWHERYGKGELPPEIRVSTLTDDPRVDLVLPKEPYFPRLYAAAWPTAAQPPPDPNSRSSSDSGSEDTAQTPPASTQPAEEVHSLYYKYYNGSSLANLVEMYSDRTGGPIPESFIWHVVEQLTRALLFLYAGLTRADLDSFTEPADETPEHYDLILNRMLQRAPWIHQDISDVNILLDSPLNADGLLEPMGRFFPDVILSGLQNATPMPTRPTNLDDVEGAIFDDLTTFYEVIKRLVKAWRHPDTGEHHQYDDDPLELLEVYTDEYRDVESNRLRSVPYLLDRVLPTARQHVDRYRTLYQTRLANHPITRPRSPSPSRDPDLYSDNERSPSPGGVVDPIAAGDVSWTMPDPTFERIPWALPGYKRDEKVLVAELRKKMAWFVGTWVPVWVSYDRVALAGDGEGDDSDDGGNEGNENEGPVVIQIDSSEEESDEDSDGVEGGENQNDTQGGNNDGEEQENDQGDDQYKGQNKDDEDSLVEVSEDEIGSDEDAKDVLSRLPWNPNRTRPPTDDGHGSPVDPTGDNDQDPASQPRPVKSQPDDGPERPSRSPTVPERPRQDTSSLTSLGNTPSSPGYPESNRGNNATNQPKNQPSEPRGRPAKKGPKEATQHIRQSDRIRNKNANTAKVTKPRDKTPPGPRPQPAPAPAPSQANANGGEVPFAYNATRRVLGITNKLGVFFKKGLEPGTARLPELQRVLWLVGELVELGLEQANDRYDDERISTIIRDGTIVVPGGRRSNEVVQGQQEIVVAQPEEVEEEEEEEEGEEGPENSGISTLTPPSQVEANLRALCGGGEEEEAEDEVEVEVDEEEIEAAGTPAKKGRGKKPAKSTAKTEASTRGRRQGGARGKK